MSPPSRAVLCGLLLAALLPGCLKPGPRIPFDTDRGYMILATSGGRSTDDRYIHGYPPTGIEVVSLVPGTAGWGWEFSVRLGDNTGKDKERKQIRGQLPSGLNYKFNASVEVERESDLVDFSAGVRQTYRLDSNLQPFFGVGLSFIPAHHEDTIGGTFLIQNPNDPNDFEVVDVPDETSRDYNLGLYLRSGLAWRINGNPDGNRLGVFLTSDVRGLVGTVFDYVELNIGLGIGR